MPERKVAVVSEPAVLLEWGKVSLSHVFVGCERGGGKSDST